MRSCSPAAAWTCLPIRAPGFLLSVALMFGASASLAAPVTFNTALPVSEGHAIGRILAIYGEAHGGGNRIRIEKFVTMLGYGVTPDLAIFTTLPIVSHDLDRASGGSRSASGNGDLQLFVRYTVLRRDSAGSTIRLAPFVGIELPSGDHRRHDASGRLPVKLQPGSGSWNPFGGAVFTWNTTTFNLDGQLAWQVNGTADGRDIGTRFHADLSLQKRLLSYHSANGGQRFVFGGIEFNYEDEDQSRAAGAVIPGTGGRQFFLTPTLQYTATGWVAEAAIQIPVTEELNGANMRQDFVAHAGIRINF